jgi:hypothetical protein
MRYAIGALSMIVLVSAHADDKGPASVKAEQLATTIRETCKALTVTSRDMHRVAQQLGVIVSDKKDDIVVTPSKAIFVTAHVHRAEVEFTLQRTDGITVAAVQKRFGPAKENHAETYIPTPKWMDDSSSAQPVSRDEQPTVTLDFRRITGSDDNTCMLSATAIRGQRLGDSPIVSISVIH